MIGILRRYYESVNSESVFKQLMSGSFKTSREGTDVFLQINSETELLHIRQITRIPMFIKF